jgi:hypothetical protein
MTQNAGRKSCSYADAPYFGKGEGQAPARVPSRMHVRRGVSILDLASRTLRAITMIASAALFQPLSQVALMVNLILNLSGPGLSADTNTVQNMTIVATQ